MRLILLLLVLAVTTQAGLLDIGKVKDFFKGGKYGEKIKNATLLKFKKLFEKTGILSLGSKLSEMRSKLMKKLELSKLKKVEVDRKIKEIMAKRDDTVEKAINTIFDINAGNNVGQLLYQSDILLTKKQAEEVIESIEGKNGQMKRQAVNRDFNPDSIWEDGVFYRFDESTDPRTRKIFELSAKQWENATCIDFTEDKEEKEPHFISVVKSEGCFSEIGRVGFDQWLSLGQGCDQIGIATHEIGHALGLFHTMSRYDRDDFITVVIDNVVDNFVDQYIPQTEETSDNYGLTYDYGSIMHYGASSATFSRNGEPTMIANDTLYQKTMGSYILSFLDKSLINEHYECKAKCPQETSAPCQNGGFPHPRKCSECICPSGYGGALCNERPAGCGQTLTATDKKQFLINKLGHGQVPSDMRDDYLFCNYWIEAPKGKRIEVKINAISHGYDYDGCVLGGVEIKSSADQTRTGYRFCSTKDKNTVLVSATNRMPVIMFNRSGEQQIILEYKIVS